MEPQLVISNSVVINATKSKVWTVLTDPAETKKYMFGCEVVTDWHVGHPIVWKGIFDGKELVAVSGKVKAYQQEKFLAYTAFDPNSNILDVPQNHTTVTYTVNQLGTSVELTVTQGDFAKVADGERRYKESTDGGGWDPILQEIKKIAEAK
jgi:uncharacterized protein YndB with AHSA1/START domain